jgi:phosphopantetheinyl transferase (holo-ACP synthase)
MIGNDIVDLELAAQESHWQRPGYLEKIFTAEEQSMIANAENPTVMVWLIWSRKEAVYKIINRQSHIRTYAPLKFQCSAKNFVTYEGSFYPFKSYQTDNCIHTVAVERAELFDALDVHTGQREQWNISKDEYGIPFLEGKPVSVSHHGRYAALVIYNDNNPGNSLIL